MNEITIIEIWLHDSGLYVNKTYTQTMPSHYNTSRSIIREAKKVAGVSRYRHIVRKDLNNTISLVFPGKDLYLTIWIKFDACGSY